MATYSNRKLALRYDKTEENGSTETITSILTNKAWGDTIGFRVTNRNFVLASPPSELTYEANKYYTKNGTKYTKITSEAALDKAINEDHKNIYMEENTKQFDCPACRNSENESTGTVTLQGKEYVCPCCKGEKVVVKGIGTITGLSVFYTLKNGSGKSTVKYQVIPPGSVSSTLIPKEEILSGSLSDFD